MTLLANVDSHTNPLRVGIGGPADSGKTALVEALCKRLREHYDIYVITNDIYTKEDPLILTRAEALPPERIIGVETGGCPHTAIREDASMNLAAIEVMSQKFQLAELCLIESGGQSCGNLQPRAGGLNDLCDRRRGRRKNTSQGRPWHNTLQSSCSGCAENARKPTFRVHELDERQRCRSNRKLCHREGRIGEIGIVRECYLNRKTITPYGALSSAFLKTKREVRQEIAGRACSTSCLSE